MKQVKTCIFGAGLIVLTAVIFAFRPQRTVIVKDGKGFALIELFTSEGCSSCPPAEELVAKIQQEAADRPVYVLAYHVDYWDHQGWKDLYSDPAYSQRQKDYSGWLGGQDIYTPQVVVNGRRELVGSDASALRSALNNALTTASSVSVTLSAHAAGTLLSVDYKADRVSDADRLLVAVVQKSALSRVTGGENGGRTLQHVQIVRSLKQVAIAPSGKGSVSITLPAGIDADTANWEVVGFIQNTHNGVVYAAGKANWETGSAAGASAAGAFSTAGAVKNVVIVHGAFADASGWEDVYKILKHDGYSVTLVQNPLTSLDADVAATSRALERIDGPAVLVGHSWAGNVITQAGVSPKVASLVYVAAFVPDSGQSVIDLAKTTTMFPKNGILPPDAHGQVYFSKELFHECFAADLSQEKSDFMYDAQQPIAAACFGAPVTQTAWKTRPVYAIVATEDKAIQPSLERAMYKHAGAVVTEVKSCHVVFQSHPEIVARVIEDAAKAGAGK